MTPKKTKACVQIHVGHKIRVKVVRNDNKKVHIHNDGTHLKYLKYMKEVRSISVVKVDFGAVAKMHRMPSCACNPL